MLNSGKRCLFFSSCKLPEQPGDIVHRLQGRVQGSGGRAHVARTFLSAKCENQTIPSWKRAQPAFADKNVRATCAKYTHNHRPCDQSPLVAASTSPCNFSTGSTPRGQQFTSAL